MYSLDEIKKIEQLLMSQDEANIQLAIQMVEHQPVLIKEVAQALSVVAYLSDKYIETLHGKIEDLLYHHLGRGGLGELQSQIIILDYARYQFKGEWNIYNSALRHYYYHHKKYIQDYIRLFKFRPKRFAPLYDVLASRIENEWPNYQEAIFCYETALKIQPEDSSAWFGWAKAWHHHYIQKEKHLDLIPKVIDAYLKAFEKSENAQCCVELALIYEQIEDWETSIDYYKKAMTLEVKKDRIALIYNNLANIHLKHSKDFERAQTLAISAYMLNTVSESTLDTLGHIALEGFGDHKAAKKWFSKALDIDGKHHYSLTGLGDLHKELGNYSQALDYYYQGLKSDLNYCTYNMSEWLDKIEKLVNLLYYQLNDIEQSVYYCNKVLRIRPKNQFALKMLGIMNRTI
ncbi:MAG: tetratricopeptide repeat protein [Aureispira sp.]|nr:tetratricopeptide repeat protein [Aureispira sp.]